jgi:hypothetical protein
MFWVLTGLELVLVQELQVVERSARAELAGEVEVTDVGVSVRLRATDARKSLVGTFRKPNRLTKALAEVLEGNAR